MTKIPGSEHVSGLIRIYTVCLACADPGIFVRGVQVKLKKALTFFSPYLISQMVNFEENYQYSRFKRGSNIYQGGSNFFHWGVQLLVPIIETHVICDFPWGVRTPCPPSGSTLALKLIYFLFQ